MKKIIFVLCASVALPAMASAADWNYATGNNNAYQGGYYQQQRGYQQPASRSYQQPARRQPQYQNNNYQQRGYQQQPAARGYQQQPATRGYQQQPRQQQRTQQNRYNNQKNSYDYLYANSSSSNNDKTFYVTPRLGFSYTSFTNGGSASGFGLVANVAGGMYFNQMRAEIEFGYHFKREIGDSKLDYSEMDFFANGYYDFDIGSQLTPFIGGSVGFANQKFSASDYDDISVSETNFAMGLAGGATYQINDMISVEGLARAHYVFCTGHLWNLQVLGGVRFSF